MSEYCECPESQATATSSCPATDVIMVAVEVANGSSSMVAGPQPQGVVVSAAVAANSVTLEAYALLISEGSANSAAYPNAASEGLLTSSARGASAVVQALSELAVSTAAATDRAPTASASQLLVSAASALSTIVSSGALANELLMSDGVAKAFLVSQGLSEDTLSSASANSVLVVVQREASESAISSAEVTSTAGPSTAPQVFLLVSVADAASTTETQISASALLNSLATAFSDVWYEDPTSKAWVMNTETTAMSWYDNFLFESLTSFNGREFAVGPAGIYELTGDTDNGAPVDAEVTTGFTDFDVAQTKRVDALYFGYTAKGWLSLTAETYDSGYGPSTYYLEQRDAGAPRNTRVVPGKGMWGRYWRMTIRNVNGADFEISDAAVDIAVSTRRL